MDKKIVITIIFASLLAFLCACLLFKKNLIEEVELEQVPEVKEEIVLDKTTVENKIEMNEDDKPEIKKSDSDIIVKPVEEKIIIQQESIINNQLEDNNQEVIQQTSVSKEEIKDAGIIKNNEGVIEITREFRADSLTKYSFKDFGIIDKSSK